MPEPLLYTLRFPAPASHYVEVEAEVPTGGRDRLELWMAVWTPGSYLVREYSRHLEGLAVRSPDGRALEAEKIAKNRWRIATGGAGRVSVSYRLYARELSVRANWVDPGFALLNGAATFLAPAEEPSPAYPGPAYEVRVEPAPAWTSVVTPLPAAPHGRPHTFLAESYDRLVDSPIYAGRPATYRFEVAGVPHLLVDDGEAGVWDGARSARDLARIAAAQRAFWGSFPYPSYTVLNLLHGERGDHCGLEHSDSTVLLASPFASRVRKDYLVWLALASHELFHAWNGKRLRPLELGPFDYESEVYTESLWVVEGITSYYDDLLVHRAGLSSRREYLAALAETLEKLQGGAGRLVQPLAEASFDAWIKHYRRDENSANSRVSYYTKGAVVAWLLDAEVRRATGGTRSLDDALRLAWARYSGERGFSGEEFRATVEEVAGADLGGFFRRAIFAVEELDLAPALDWFGLRLARKGRKETGGAKAEPEGWLGFEHEDRSGALVVTAVPRDTPAAAAGFDAGDEVLALDGFRVAAAAWEDRLAAYRPGQAAQALVARRGRLIALPLTFGAAPEPRLRLEPDRKATAEQRARCEAWLARLP